MSFLSREVVEEGVGAHLSGVLLWEILPRHRRLDNKSHQVLNIYWVPRGGQTH